MRAIGSAVSDNGLVKDLVSEGLPIMANKTLWGIISAFVKHGTSEKRGEIK
jgi:hypothetical protein